MRLPQFKICGINDAAFALAACARADYLGFIFAQRSPRRVEIPQAEAIVRAVRAHAPHVKCVGVFTGGSPAAIANIARQIPIDVVQLHGDFPAADVSALKTAGLEVWRLDTDGEMRGEDALLLDGAVRGVSGGTGTTADWTRARRFAASGRRIVLAGGIGAGNLVDAMRTGAAILDINSSLESAPGKKDLARLERLFEIIADLEQTSNIG